MYRAISWKELVGLTNVTEEDEEIATYKSELRAYQSPEEYQRPDHGVE